MKTTPKGIENLTDDERRVTRIDEAKEIPEFPGYFLTPLGWVWDEVRGKFLIPKLPKGTKVWDDLVTDKNGGVTIALYHAGYPLYNCRRPRTIWVYRRLQRMFR